MDMDKIIRGKVLDDLMKDMDNRTFEKRVKPRVITISIDTGGGSEEGPEPQEESVDESIPGEVEDDDMDPRLARIMKNKMG